MVSQRQFFETDICSLMCP